MARGELADPVAVGGEGDEIGRLTLALEDMRRALRDKLRSTEEVNLDLERAVQMRTADLARKNRELAETLDKLTRAQAQLVRSEKLASIGQLVAGIAHEINNPVNAIVNTVGPLEEAIGDIDSADATARGEAARDVREMVRVVQRGAQRTKAIVTALHNYSRTDDESVVEFDVDRSIDDSLELLRHLLKDKTVTKRYGDVGRVRGHAGQVNQVFMNLLTNAAQALSGRPDATITVETTGDAGAVEVKIGDNGQGIPPDVLPRIWDPFFTTKDVGEGTGLGLSICHGIISGLGGQISIDSSPGHGTIVRVVLPPQAESVDAPAPTLVVEPGTATNGQRRHRVMLVDDEPQVAQTMERLLRRDYDVTLAGCGRDAIDLINRGVRFDAIVSDVMMPNMTGIELIEELQRIAPDQAQRLIFLSGGAFTAQTRERLDQLGAPQLEKPITARELRACVNRIAAETDQQAA